MRLFFFIIFLCNALIILAQPESKYYNSATQAYIGFFSGAWKNPALMKQYPYTSYTELSASHHTTQAEELYLVQDGDQSKLKRFLVHSYIKDLNKYYYGKASYSKGLKANQNWISSSDYALIQPYFVADTIGGDLHTEQYLFSGGYAYSSGKTTIGIHGKYTADTQFRKRDPRPMIPFITWTYRLV